MTKLAVQAPYDRCTIKEYEMHSEEQAFDVLEKAHAVYRNREAWLSKTKRIEILTRLADDIADKAPELALQAAREGGKPLQDSLVEIRRAENGVRVAVEEISRLTGEEIPMGVNAKSENHWAVTYREPRGVVFAISAFNHPFNLLIHQVVTAVAAGCPVVVKPASTTPMSCESLVSMLHEAGLPESHCQMILTENEVTQKLVGDPRVAFLTFIGSSKIGWLLRSKLAPGADCALEHGGVAPVIFDETADLEDALPRLTKASFYHAGQVCVSIQRIYVHASRVKELSSGLVESAKELVVGDPTKKETEVGPLIRPSEVDRVHEWVEEARKAGAKILCGGKKLSETTYAPTVILDPPHDAKVTQDEIFGPVVCVYTYENIEHAIEKANLEHAYFQASLFTNRLDRALDIGKRLHGMATLINEHTAFRVDWMPFGGHRDSGLKLGGISHSMRDMTLERMILFRQK